MARPVDRTDMARSTSSVRIGEAERSAAQRALHDHLNAGRLQVEEYADRTARAANAVTAAEIAALFTDLPQPRPKLPGGAGGGRKLLLGGAAVAVLVVGGLVFFGLSSGGTSSTPSPVAVPTSAPVVVDPLPETSVPALPDASAEGTAGPLPGGVTLRRSTAAPITLRPGYGVDLDEAVSPNWSVGRGCCSRDVTLGNRGENLDPGGDFAAVTGAPTYTTCATETAYTNGLIEVGSLQPGLQLCVRTSESRYALVTIVDASPDAVQLRALVWDPPLS